jgi:putative transposase
VRAIAEVRRRFDYRRLHVLLRPEGCLINHKKLFRLYREERLAFRSRGGRMRAIGTRTPMTVPMAPNDRWSLDFVSDQLTDGRRFRIQTVVELHVTKVDFCPEKRDFVVQSAFIEVDVP